MTDQNNNYNESHVSLTIKVTKKTISRFKLFFKKILILTLVLVVGVSLYKLGETIFHQIKENENKENIRLYQLKVDSCKKSSTIEISVFSSVKYYADTNLCIGSRYISGYGYHSTFWDLRGSITPPPENFKWLQGPAPYEEFKEMFILSQKYSWDDRMDYISLVCSKSDVFYQNQCLNLKKKEMKSYNRSCKNKSPCKFPKPNFK